MFQLRQAIPHRLLKGRTSSLISSSPTCLSSLIPSSIRHSQRGRMLHLPSCCFRDLKTITSLRTFCSTSAGMLMNKTPATRNLSGRRFRMLSGFALLTGGATVYYAYLGDAQRRRVRVTLGSYRRFVRWVVGYDWTSWTENNNYNLFVQFVYIKMVESNIPS